MRYNNLDHIKRCHVTSQQSYLPLENELLYFLLKQTFPIWKPGGELLLYMCYIDLCGLKEYRGRHGDLRC